MTWETIDNYLRKVAKACKTERANLVLVRRNNEPVVVSQENWNHGYLKPDYGYGARLHYYEVRNAAKDELIASWGLYEFPSCCAFCVSTQALVVEKFRKRGINKLSNEFRQELARAEGYSALVCTDDIANIAERRTLQANGFLDVYQILNKRTDHYVAISVKPL